jgi:hypothetical protein
MKRYAFTLMFTAVFLLIPGYIYGQDNDIAKKILKLQDRDELIRADNRKSQKVPRPELSSPERGIQIPNPEQPFYTSITLENIANSDIQPEDKSATEDKSYTRFSTEPEWIIVMSEDFESTFPSGLWTIDTFTTGNWPTVDAIWAPSDCRPNNGTYSAACAAGGTAGVPCGERYPDSMYTYMAYGPFDLSDASDAYMNFYWWLISEDGWDYFIVTASINGVDFYGIQWTGYNDSWNQYSFDLTSVNVLGDLTGEPQVWVAFIFYSDYIINETEGAYVDDIELWKDISAGPADLAIEGGAFNPNPVIEDGSLAIAPQIINNGESAAIDSEIEYYLSINTTITQSDCYLGNDFVTLAPGETGFESILADLSTIDCESPGTYYVGIYFVDEGEGDYFPTPLVINSATSMPDLILSGGTFSPNPVAVDDILVINPQISNIGSETAVSYEIQYYLSPNTTITTGDTYLGNDIITVSPGETVTESITVHLETVMGISPGIYFVGIYFVNESNGESFSVPLEIIASTTAPDLSLTGGTFSPNPVYENEILYINPQITNNGLGPATSYEIEYYLSTNTTISPSDCYLGNGFVNLGPGETGIEFFSSDLTGLGCITSGTYYIGIYFVDDSEGEEFITPLEIITAPVETDLKLLGGSFTPNPVNANKTLSIFPVITYTGPGTIADTEIQYYLSDDKVIIPSDCYLGNQFVTLDSGQVSAESFSVGLNSVGCVSPGTYYIGVYFTDESAGYHILNPLIINYPGITTVSYAESEMGVSIYPNPVKDMLFVKSFADNESGLTLTIFNNLGEIIYLVALEDLKSGDEIKLDLSGINEGLYFIQICNSRIIRIEKLIKN